MKERVAEIGTQFTAENFLPSVPEKDASGCEIPHWKRLMLAKKVAEKAKKEAEVLAIQQAEAKRINSIPEWKQRILNKQNQSSKSPQISPVVSSKI